jgi:hypothetical protein
LGFRLSCVLPLCVLSLYRPAILSNVHSTFIWPSSDLHSTYVHCHSFPSLHHILKPYIVLEFGN